MATSAKPFNVYHGGKTFLPHSTTAGGMEVSQDMHLKMSKKIAQLTKVIYALNTKNDEHDFVVEELRQQHEEESQKVLAETKAKVEMYERKLEEVTDIAKRCEELQKQTQEQEKLRLHALQDFENFKRRAEERESQLKTDHAQKVLRFSQEVLQAKNDFKERLIEMEQVKEKIETDKRTEIARLRKKHEEELAKVQKHEGAMDELETDKKNLEEKLKSQLEALTTKCDSLQEENRRLTEEFEIKLKKAERFCEKELAAYKDAQSQSENERIKTMQKNEDHMRKDFALQESQYKLRIEKLQAELCDAESEISLCKKEQEKLHNIINQHVSDSKSLNRQLSTAKEEICTLSSRLRELETQLSGANERCGRQTEDLLRKSREVGELEALRLQNDSSVRDLTSRLSSTQDRLSVLENSKQALESRVGETEMQASSQIKALEQALDKLCAEKQQQREKMEQQHQELEQRNSEALERLKSDHQEELKLIAQEHKQNLENQKISDEKSHLNIQRKMHEQFTSEKETLNREHETIQAELRKLQAETQGHLNDAKTEIERLQTLLGHKETGLGSAASQITSLKEDLERINRDLATTKNYLKISKSEAQEFQAQNERMKAQHGATMKSSEEEFQQKLRELRSDMDEKWRETLRKEREIVRKEVISQKNEEMKAEMAKLSQLKDEQLAAAKQGWESKFKLLLDDMSSLKSKRDQAELVRVDEINKIQKQAENENKRLQQLLLESAMEKDAKVCELQKDNEERLQKVIKEKDAALKACEESMKQKHVQELKAQLTAHRATVQMMKEKTENDKLASLSTMQEKHREFTANLRAELQQKNAQELDEMTKTHKSQLQAAKMELERALDISRQKELDHETKKAELEDNIRHRQSAIEQLEADTKHLQTGIDQMAHELEAKGKEILNVRSEANRTLRAREEQLARRHRDELESLQADLDGEKDAMLHEFQQAQALLKDKVAALQIMLQEADEKYRNRESRPEDVDAIRRLEEAVRQREHALKRIMDDKKYYQMELVNRETNYNKVFSSAPNVGLLNPLQAKTRPRDKSSGASKPSGSPALSSAAAFTRLEPLPNSPVHDSSFSSTRPLPPTKKFVK